MNKLPKAGDTLRLDNWNGPKVLVLSVNKAKGLVRVQRPMPHAQPLEFTTSPFRLHPS